MSEMKLFEFTGYIKYAVVVGAQTEDKAKKEMLKLSENDFWDAVEFIGADGAKEYELFDIRKLEDDSDIDDCANIAEGRGIIIKSDNTNFGDHRSDVLKFKE